MLRHHIASDSVDLVYLDPPFNSNADYNILFKSPSGKAADSQIEAFEDTWHWNDKAESAFHDVMTSGNTDVAELLRAMRGFPKENDMMAYLAMMAVRLIERRMKDRYGADLAYQVIGTPNDLASAEKLTADELHQFQYWITQAIDGQPYQGGRKGADRSIDGYLYFTGHDRKTEAAIISVKAGRNVGVAMVRDLKGVIEREKAPIGIFICATNPTREMEREAAAAGVYDGADGRSYPRLQIFTLAEYFQGLRPKVPLLDRQAAYKKAARETTPPSAQTTLDL